MRIIETITPAEVRDKLDQGENLQIIDVREDEEVAHGMIPGALHIPLAKIPERQGEISKTQSVIFVCRSGQRSERAVEYLQGLGYTGLKNMTGGMLGYDRD